MGLHGFALFATSIAQNAAHNVCLKGHLSYQQPTDGSYQQPAAIEEG